jgi:hypothetical protein
MKMQDATISVVGTSCGLGAAGAWTAPERGACKRYAAALRLDLDEAGASQAMTNETRRMTRARLSTEAASCLALTTV